MNTLKTTSGSALASTMTSIEHDLEFPQDEIGLREVITSVQNEHSRVLVIVVPLNALGVLPVAVVRDRRADGAFLPGLAMRNAADLYSEQANSEAKVH